MAVTVAVAAVTVSWVVALTLFIETAMFVLPALTPVATPAELTVAIAVLDELHEAELPMFAVLPSLYAPVAVNGCVAFTAILGLAGLRAIEVSVFVDPVPVDEVELK